MNFSSGGFSDVRSCSLYDIDDEYTTSSPILEEPNYETTSVLLFKKVPYEATELNVINFCHRFGIIVDIYLMKSKGYAFVHFQQLKSAILCYETVKREGAQVKNENVYVFYTGKKEISKRDTLAKSPSRSLIMVFYTNSELITGYFVNKLLLPFGRPSQIKILKQNPYSIFVEMEDIGSAIQVKETMHNTICGGSFKVSVAYVNKQILQPDQSQSHFNSLPQFSSGFGSFGEIHPAGVGFKFPRSEGYLEDFKETEINYKAFQGLIDYEGVDGEERQNGPKTILVKNLTKGVTCDELFKLFGLYGNVMMIKIFFSNLENALVEFQDHTQAMVAKTHLNNCAFRGNNIFVTLSKNPIAFNGSIPEGNKLLGDYRDSKEHRYKIAGSKNFRNIAPPSAVLHLSNLCDHFDERFYINLFKNWGRVKKFLILKGDTKNMLVEMGSVEEAVEAIINFHNYDVEGKFLKVSFSKYQMIKD